ncbi:MAG: hypothetical protein PHP44_06220 [Kiritimatiellae bacterium]|nr:hypothetical protein [Kiritimatiellia bacterium]
MSRTPGISDSRRRGPAIITTLGVLLVLLLQGGLLLLFQWIDQPDEYSSDEEPVVQAVTQVEEREIIAPENGPEDLPPAEEIEAVQVAVEPEPLPVEPPVNAVNSEADMLELLEAVGVGQDVPPKVPESEMASLNMASTLFGQEKVNRAEPVKPPVKKPGIRPVVRPERTERVPPISARQVRVVTVEQSRFPSNDAADEMRVLNISLAMGANAGDVFGDYVGIKVTFFDEVGDTGMAMPSRVQTSTNPIRLAKRAWRSDANYLVTATYLVPKGFRTQYQKKTGARTKYYGYVIEVFYRDQLQDVYAQPKTLLPQ